jgi:hypothetical protein
MPMAMTWWQGKGGQECPRSFAVGSVAREQSFLSKSWVSVAPLPSQRLEAMLY